MPAPEQACTFDPVTASLMMKNANDTAQIVQHGFAAFAEMFRHKAARAEDIAQGLGYRIVTESGDGQARILGNMVAPKVGP